MPDDSGPGNAIGGGPPGSFGGLDLTSTNPPPNSTMSIPDALAAQAEADQAMADLEAAYGKMGTIVGFLVGLITGNPIVASAAGKALGTLGKAIARGDLSSLSQADQDAVKSAVQAEVSGQGVTNIGGGGVDIPGNIGGEGIPGSDIPGATPPPTPTQDLESQMFNLFGPGTGGLGQLFSDYENSVSDATSDYQAGVEGIQADWANFLATHKAAGDSLMNDIQDTFRLVGPEFDQIRGQFDTEIADIPQGGFVASKFGNLPVVARRHGDEVRKNAQQRVDISDPKFETLFKNLGLQGKQLTDNAGVQSTGIANRSNLLSNLLGAGLGEAQSKFKPKIDLAQFLATLKSKKDIANINKPPENDIWDKILPAFGYAAQSDGFWDMFS